MRKRFRMFHTKWWFLTIFLQREKGILNDTFKFEEIKLFDTSNEIKSNAQNSLINQLWRRIFMTLHFFDEIEDFTTLFYRNDNRSTLLFDNGFQMTQQNIKTFTNPSLNRAELKRWRLVVEMRHHSCSVSNSIKDETCQKLQFLDGKTDLQ